VNFAEKVKYLRNRKGYTQEELAKLANVTQPSIAAYESGVRKPTANTTIQIAKILCVEPIDLTDDERSVIE
jgi:transcriptional regulator with XRE-family HTH domain